VAQRAKPAGLHRPRSSRTVTDIDPVGGVVYIRSLAYY
jgi:hypothetical protein